MDFVKRVHDPRERHRSQSLSPVWLCSSTLFRSIGRSPLLYMHVSVCDPCGLKSGEAPKLYDNITVFALAYGPRPRLSSHAIHFCMSPKFIREA